MEDEKYILNDTNEESEPIDDEVQGISIAMEEDNSAEDNDIEIKEEDIIFPVYYTTTYVGSTTITCSDESGEVVVKTIEELANEEPGKYKIHSLERNNITFVKSEFDIIEEQNIDSILYKITFINGFEVTCGSSSTILMCNDVWLPIQSLEAGDYALGIKYVSSEEISDDGNIIPSILEIKSIEEIKNTTEKTYAILNNNCNTLLAYPLNDKEAIFAVLQQ